MAMGSLYEVETQTSIARRLGMRSEDDERELLELSAEAGRLLGDSSVRARAAHRLIANHASADADLDLNPLLTLT
jgi:hypothetical protein